MRLQFPYAGMASAAAVAMWAAPALGMNPAPSSAAVSGESFTEDLFLKPLADGKVLLHFEFAFQRSQDQSNSTQHHYHLFPRQIGEIALRYDVEELHLSFTQGNWREARWGHPPVNSQGVGAEVRARIKGSEEHVAARWAGLTNALSGVFCASLNFVDSTNTVMPQMMFAEQQQQQQPKHAGVLRQGYLPRENVCTENLTPWIKQLPCQSRSGLGALLNPHRLYNMHFHSMGMSLETTEPSDNERPGASALRYTQHLSVVLDPRAFGLEDGWSLSELMDTHVAQACPVANRSTVRVLASPGSGVSVKPEASSRSKLAGLDMYVFDMLKQRNEAVADIELLFEAQGPSSRSGASTEQPAVAVHRYVTGHGGSSGGVEATVINRGDKPVDILYLDSLPWYLRVYSHTLTIATQKTSDDSASASSSKAQVPDHLAPSTSLFAPAIDRGRPSTMELALTLPARSRTTLRYGFDKGFLKYTEHPPDANRGFNIGPAIVSYSGSIDDAQPDRRGQQKPKHHQPLACAIKEILHGDAAGSRCTTRIYSELFLANMPTPDFSMPYNVITFTCTILALFFGRIFNLLTRDFAVLEPKKRENAKKEDALLE
ncbi:Subunit of the glycosylphosphatidylinositol transamidase complex-like protein [Coemansia sp. RSA 2599]|nr:Subunit of the glycosylphosphatidylinositol transamidase complex-like protein [Coemansia sp. RSA 2599]